MDSKQSDDHPNHAAAALKMSSATLGDFITLPESSRYLLGDPGSFSGLRDYSDQVLGLVPVPVPQLAVQGHQKQKDDKSSVPAAAPKLSSSARFNKSSSDQVLLRISLKNFPMLSYTYIDIWYLI